MLSLLNLGTTSTGDTDSDPTWRAVVKVVDSVYQRGPHEVCTTRTIRLLRRLSSRMNNFTEDLSNIGAEEFAASITNLHDVQPGLYTLEVTDVSRDWESGCIDSWQLRLQPYTEPAR